MKRYKKLISTVLALTLTLSGFSIPQKVQAEQTNLAYGKTARSDSDETSNLVASKVTDGDLEGKYARWASAVNSNAHWVYVDLGKEETIRSVRVVWETRKATNYRIQVSNNASSWTDAKVLAERPASYDEVIVLEEAVQARYVRLYIDAFDALDPDGSIEWNNISVYEVEVYSDVFEKPKTPIEMVTVELPKDGNQLIVNIPENEKVAIKYNGTDYEQVIGEDLTIYEPIVDTNVLVSFKAVSKTDESDYEFREIELTVPGKYTQEEGDNEAPVVIPELREWKGYNGEFTIAKNAKVVIADETLRDVAEIFAADYKELSGKPMEVVVGTVKDTAAGEFYFEFIDDSKGLDEEGYLMEIKEKVTVKAEAQTGAMWATRTILQALKSGAMTTMPQGITRDYPLYKVRGLMLDVGRKTQTMDYLKQVVKEMAWYKMNDLHVHLNDNFIWVEKYANEGKNPLDAYSGFRLESEVKKGETVTLNGKEFTYSADLTNTDVYYTKDEFRNFIQESDVYGVNIVPEIDTPAHSLALTKVLPELRYSSKGRDNDHLDLKSQYKECYEFVTNIFGEYMEEENPVFSEDTVVHIGCDEFKQDPNAFRRFCNDLADYVESTGRTARIWGSFTEIAGDGSVKVDGTGIQLNLWDEGYANMGEMYEMGFDLIDCNDNDYYIVPNAGYYRDYLTDGTLYNDPANKIGKEYIPSGDKQMLGGMYAVWNDMVDRYDNGVSEYDIYDRIASSTMGLYAAKVWGKGNLTLEEAKEVSTFMGDAPNTNFGYEVEADENGIVADWNEKVLEEFAAEGVNTSFEKVDSKNAVKLNGGESYVKTNLETVGLNNSLTVKVKRTSDSAEEQILFESPYGEIKAVQSGTGNVGISRENHDYSFNYKLPVDQWVELTFKNEFEQIHLYVNGKWKDTLGDGEGVDNQNENHRPLLATCMFPVAAIGSETNAFEGYVTDVLIANVIKSEVENERTRLEELLEQTYRIKLNTYTASTAELVDFATGSARALLADKNTSEEELGQAYEMVERAVVMLEPRENIALRKPVTPSHNQKEANMIIDGSLSGYWAAYDESGDIPMKDSHFIVDLQGIYDLKAINLVPYYASVDRYYQYDILVSTDGENWRKVVEQRSTQDAVEEGMTFEFDQPTEARYVKVEGVAMSVSGRPNVINFHVHEMRVFGDLIEKLDVEPEEVKVLQNLALYGKVTANEGAKDLFYIADGKSTENKYSDSNAGITDSFVTVELPDTSMVEKFRVVTYANKTDRWYTWEVLVSEDNENWISVGKYEIEANRGYDGHTIVLDEPVSAKYVKVQGLKTNNMKFHLVEVEAWGTMNNIALYKPVTVSSIYKGDEKNGGAGIADGSLGNAAYWDSGDVPPTKEEWPNVAEENLPYAIIDLGGMYDLDTVNVMNYYRTEHYYHYRIYTSRDGNAYTLFAEKTDNELSWYSQTHKADEPTIARYIKIVGTYCSANPGYHVLELRATGSPVEEAEADYTAVDAAMAKIPADLSVYTIETVFELKTAIAAVKENLGVSEQAKVDAMASSIEAALKALELKEETITPEPTPEPMPEPTPEPTPGPEVCEVFADVKHGAWYESGVQFVYAYGLMSGSNGLFNPTADITRAQIVTTLYRLAGSPAVTDTSALKDFADVAEDKYYTNAVCWAYAEGIATGNNGKFDPTGKLTRQQMAAFFYRYAEYADLDTKVRGDISSMLNADKVSGYAKDPVEWAVGTGLISGSEATDANGNKVKDLNPRGNTTRAQVAVILMRFCEGNKI